MCEMCTQMRAIFAVAFLGGVIDKKCDHLVCLLPLLLILPVIYKA